MEILSKKGKRKFYSDGFSYVFDRTSSCGNIQFWRCDRRTIDGRSRCKARIHVQGDIIIKKIGNHCHDSSAAQVEADITRTAIKRRAEVTMEQPAQVINECVTELSQGAQAALAKHGALKKMIRRKRNQLNAAPPAPLRIEQLVIPEQYKIYMVNGVAENFLLSDEGDAVGNRVLIFGRQNNLNILKESTHWYVDGTFTSSPQLFYQVYVIMAERYMSVHPIVYVLLQNKQATSYAIMINRLKELEPNLNPQKISCDFELAAINAFKNGFPNAEILGCFFHLTQNLRKHLGQLHLLGRYNNDADFALTARMITSLAFVPIPDLDDAIERLANIFPDELQPLLLWFEENYMGRPNRRGNGRRPPIFSPAIWSVYNRTLEGTDRTNNFAEAAHRRLKTELGMDNPVIWKFIDSLKKIQRGRDIILEQLIAGHRPTQKRRKYVEIDNRIRAIVNDYNNRDIIDYLRGISHNYEMDP